MDASSAFQDSLPVTSDALLAQLRGAGVDFTYYEHVPLKTVDDAKLVQGIVVPDGAGTVDVKNFYLRDRKKRNHLVVLEQDRVVDLKTLGKSIAAPGLSFGSAERLMEHLGVRPGAVSPLAMITGAPMGVHLIMDNRIRDARVVHVHPLVNDRTVGIAPSDLEQVLRGWGAKITWFDPEALA